MTEVPAYLDKDALRRRVPLAHAAAILGIHFSGDRAICPFHEDHTPSLQLWQDDRGIERWTCFPCGLSGDIYDLVRRHEGLSFNDAVSYVADLAETAPVAPARAPKAEFDLAAAETLVAASLSRALDNSGWLCVVAGLLPENADEEERVEADLRLRVELSWGVDHAGNLVMPHYDALGRLTGIKLRALNGEKWAFPGSRWPALYGAWRGRRSRDVLLCAGESDLGYALLQGASPHLLGLPRGERGYSEVWGSLEADVYYLAFDADATGLAATRHWVKVLDGRDVRVCRLPRGHDLRSARPDMSQLLDHAVSPRAPSMVITHDTGRFERLTQNGPRALCNWYVEPTARLEAETPGSMPALEVNVHADGRSWSDILSLGDLQSASKLREWSARRSLDCMASDADAQLLGSTLLTRSLLLPEVFQTTRVGAHAAPSRYRYAGRSVVTPTGFLGQLPWRYVGPGEVEGHVHLAGDEPANLRWLDTFLRLSSTDVTHPLLAWLIAAARRDELAQFPLLFLGGTSGSGKTTTARLATRLLGSSLGVSLASVTQFALIRTLAVSTTLPVFVDEWSLQSRADARETVQAVIPVIYEGGVTPRGRADLTVVEYRLASPVLLAGEDSFHLDREADRIVALRLSRAAQNFKALEELERSPLHRFGRWFHQWLVTSTGLPEVPGPGLTRPEYNRACLELGWATLLTYLRTAAEHGEEVPDLPETPDFSALGAAVEGRENEYEAYVSEAEGMRDQNGLPLVWLDKDGRGLWVRFRQLTSNRNMSGVDVELPGRSRAMRQYFGDRFRLIDDRVRPPLSDKSVRATLIVDFHGDTAVGGQ